MIELPLVFEARYFHYFLGIWTEKSLVLCDPSSKKQKTKKTKQTQKKVNQ
jgi:hypothetical protein